ncbi:MULTISPECIES: hypothetical protein [unclassified Variovorax]|uniref:hypothetical protein n=1 Tax=unclassified Variovorax TaxID=663243 RepID=UPI0025753545|nr:MULTISPECIES: hypothetical protein [unclassified Variovorax]MDM0086304.1 hypothetical protein [Variovorax sp. J22G40]MDM0145439.1 hypothetical protein [Variovorax sp. J2P1-31]
MRVFGLVGLVLALLIVGVLAKKQLATPLAVVPGQAAPAVRAQTQQLQQDIQKSLDAAAQQQRRAMPEEAN